MEIIDFKIRKSNNNDQKFIWEWRNDSNSRSMFFNTAFVSWEEHREWYEEIERDNNKLCLVAEINEQIIAVSHFQNNHGVASISINTNPKIRGQGQGYRLIRKFSDFAKESLGLTEIIAVVKANNTQSIKSFIKAGFEEIERLNDEKKIKYKLNFD